LFEFEIEILYFCNRFWLVEYCVFWNGARQIVEMVEIGEYLNDYAKEQSEKQADRVSGLSSGQYDG